MAEKVSEEQKDILSKATWDFYKKFIQDDARVYNPGHRFLPLEDQLVKATSADFLPPPGIDPDSSAFQDSKKYVEKLITTTNELRRKSWEHEQRLSGFRIVVEDCLLRSFQNSEPSRNSNSRSSRKKNNQTTGTNQSSKAEKIAEQNAMELIKEEEEAKSKAQRKTAKKGKNQMKKVNNKTSTLNNVPTEIIRNSDGISHGVENLMLNNDGRGEVHLEEKSTFVDTSNKWNEQSVKNNNPKLPDVESIFEKALESIEKKEYNGAIHNLSKAINLAPKRVDVLLKRSWVYFETSKYEESIKDAENSLKIEPSNLEGYYRLGEAKSALKNYSEADAAFSELVDHLTYKSKVKDKLFSLRIKQLEEMGYNSNEAFTALHKSENKTLIEAIDFLTALRNGTVSKDDLYYSDEEDSDDDNVRSEEETYEESKENENIDKTTEEADKPLSSRSNATVKPEIVVSKSSTVLTDSTNPTKCCSLYVANMRKHVTLREVKDVFAKFGDISSIKLLTHPKVYAFVNYAEWKSAGQAMEALQGSRSLLGTNPLVVKFPDKIVNELMSGLIVEDDSLQAEKHRRRTNTKLANTSSQK